MPPTKHAATICELGHSFYMCHTIQQLARLSVCVGLTRTLPKAPMATSGGSSMGRAYVPPTCSSSGARAGD